MSVVVGMTVFTLDAIGPADATTNEVQWDNTEVRLPRFTRTASVRTRMTGIVALLAAVALAGAGAVASSLQTASIDARIDAELRSEMEEFRVLATEGIDPDTGESFATAADAVRTAIARIIPARHEGTVGMVNGELAFVPRQSPVDLDADTELLAAIADDAQGDQGTISRVVTSTTEYQVAVIPVRAASFPSGGDVAALVVAYDRQAELREFHRVFSTYALVAAFAWVVVTAVAWLAAGRALRPVRVLANASRSIGLSDVSERIPVEGRDDMAAMTHAVNAMLDRIEALVGAQRQTLRDVSHELRTPLTIIRGHLDTYDPKDPVDVAATAEIVRDEVDRMNGLVDDLLTLATADLPQFVEHAPVDIAELTRDVWDKATGLGPAEWVLGDVADVMVDGDARRLTQAWLQLCSNAYRHAPAGTTIVVESRISDGAVCLAVSDQGPGVPETERERIFERFVKGGSSSGSGLGLTIVATIAEAHGGESRCLEAAGGGARFEILVPVSEDDA